MEKATEADLLKRKYEWRRDAHGQLQKYNEMPVYEYGGKFTVEDLTKIVNASGFEEAKFEVESFDEYGDHRARLVLSGWANALPQEVQEALDSINDFRQLQADRDAEDIERLKKTHPHLFRD